MDTVNTWYHFKAFQVAIPANVYAGRYYDYRATAYNVFIGYAGVDTEQDAIDWVNNNKDQVLAEIDMNKIISGNRKRRAVKKPAEKNVFFKETYNVRGPFDHSRRSDAKLVSNLVVKE